ncbi:MAG TPA: glycosyltransferase family 2 protein [Vicinamibacterales bacterium]|nr:glycosyltransferase family 2 protein [Vicinamibacterales bacterium]
MFSVIIATRNRQALLAETLSALALQDWPVNAFEIIVADNGSADATSSVVADAAARLGAPLIRYVFVPEPGKSAAVNQALGLATGDLIALTDDDVRPEKDWLTRLAAAFDETGADFVAGRVTPAWETSPPDWLSPSVYGVIAVPDNGSERIEITPDHHEVMPIGANMAVRRAVVVSIGGLRVDLGKLDGSLRTGEDHEFFLRMLHAGFRGAYEPTALVHHRVGNERLDRGYFRRWLHQNGRDVARLNQVYSAHVPRLLGAPRYLWRQAVSDGASAIRAAASRDRARRFGAAARLIWFAGYLREAWLGTPQPPAALLPDGQRTSPFAHQAG